MVSCGGSNTQQLFKFADGHKTQIGERQVVATKRKSVKTFSPSFNAATGRYTWMVDYDESIIAKLDALYPGTMYTTDVSDEHFPEERQGKRIVSGRIWHPKTDLRQAELEEQADGILARPKEIVDFAKAFPRPKLGKHVWLAASGQLWETKGGPFQMHRDHRAVVFMDDSEWRMFETHTAIMRTILNPDIPYWSDHWSFLLLDAEPPTAS